MKTHNTSEVEGTEEAPGVLMRTVIGAKEGAQRFVMRRFEIEPGGSTPYHSHDWEHEVFILSGQGTVRSKEGETTLKQEDVVFLEPNEEHCFTNKGQEPLRFVCVIPRMEGAPQ